MNPHEHMCDSKWCRFCRRSGPKNGVFPKDESGLR